MGGGLWVDVMEGDALIGNASISKQNSQPVASRAHAAAMHFEYGAVLYLFVWTKQSTCQPQTRKEEKT